MLLAVIGTTRCDGGSPGGEPDVAEVEELISYPAATVERDPEAHIALEPVRSYGASETGAGLLYRPTDIDIDADGRIFVIDGGNKNIVVFSAEGDLLRTMSREGEGPGEIQMARGIAVTDGMTFAIGNRARLSAWDGGGELIQDVRLARNETYLDLAAFDDGTLVASYVETPSGPDDVDGHHVDQVIAGYSGDGTLLREYITTPRRFRTRSTPLVGVATSIFEVDRSGRIYVSDAASYEITAIDADGSRPWRLRVDKDPRPVTESDIELLMDSMRTPADRSDFEWPDHHVALAGLRVDGHGHLYVFPFVFGNRDADRRPVDVYDRDGGHLFSGTIDAVSWRLGSDDLVYGFAEDEASGGRVVVAYRLAEPFGAL